jgi:hypothetical protein
MTTKTETIKTTYFVVYDSRFAGIGCKDIGEARIVLENVRDDYPGALIHRPFGQDTKTFIPPG